MVIVIVNVLDLQFLHIIKIKKFSFEKPDMHAASISRNVITLSYWHTRFFVTYKYRLGNVLIQDVANKSTMTSGQGGHWLIGQTYVYVCSSPLFMSNVCFKHVHTLTQSVEYLFRSLVILCVNECFLISNMQYYFTNATTVLWFYYLP